MRRFLPHTRSLHNQRGFAQLPSLKDSSDASEGKKRVGGFHAALLSAIAGLFDGIQFILTWLLIGVLVNWIITLFAWFFFYLWFALVLKTNFWSHGAKKALTMFGSIIFEFIPGFNALPAITGGVIIMIALINLERSISKASGGKIKAF